ncbi:hypothetical protein [Enterocloster bolteae]|uniref:hypothetical protein n=1 Tax=Enterocloster bolteae TaxID=208479 RepID=UPI003AF0BFCD
MIKKVLSILLSLFIIALCPLTAFAMVATPSDAIKVPVASSSNALPSQEYMETDDFDTLDVIPLSDGDNYTSTVDLSKVQYFYRYKDSAGQLRVETGYLTSEGYFSVPLLPDYSSTEYCLFSLDKSVIPNPGKYSVSVHFGSNTGGFTYDGFQVEYIQSFKSANTKFTQLDVNAVQSSGDYSYDTAFQIDSSVTRLTFISKFKPPAPLPYGGYFSVSFTRLNNASDVGFSPPSFTTSDDINQNIADNTGQIVEKQDTIIDQIMDVTETISNQLTAFWNQLAGEFTNLYNKMNQQHADQIQADRNNTEDLIAAEESNTTNIINNNNANTDKLAYGYDSSVQDQKNDELGSKLNEYDSAESEIFDSVSGNISDFNMDDYKIEDSSLLAGIVWVSDFMQQLFVSMGLFNLPVTISLVLIFVVIMIGYYRIRS